MRFGIVVSAWHEQITDALFLGCIETLSKHGGKEENMITTTVPGSFELPAGAQLIAETQNVDAIICIGCVIKGETKHDEYISNAVANGLVELNLKYNLPFIFGVLTPNNTTQAKERAGGKHGNKGVEAAISAIKMVQLKRSIGKQ